MGEQSYSEKGAAWKGCVVPVRDKSLCLETGNASPHDPKSAETVLKRQLPGSHVHIVNDTCAWVTRHENVSDESNLLRVNKQSS